MSQSILSRHKSRPRKGCLMLRPEIHDDPHHRGRCWILSLPMAHSHMLLEQALSSDYIPKKNQSLIPDYNLCLRVFSRTATSVRRRIKKSIITGCISSVLLFALTTNLIIKWTEVACRLLMSKPVRSLQLEDSWMTFYDFICAWCRWSCSGCGSSHGQDWGLSLPSLGLWYSLVSLKLLQLQLL